MIHLSRSVRLAKKDVRGCIQATHEIIPKTKTTHEITPKTSTGAWCLVLGMLQRGGKAVEESTEESNEDDKPWITWCLKEN